MTTLDAGIALKRRIIEDLRPSSLTNLGLVPSLEILCAEFTERSGIRVIPHLAGMQFRVQSGNGELSIWSRPGEGTRIVARLPESVER